MKLLKFYMMLKLNITKEGLFLTELYTLFEYFNIQTSVSMQIV